MLHAHRKLSVLWCLVQPPHTQCSKGLGFIDIESTGSSPFITSRKRLEQLGSPGLCPVLPVHSAE